MSDTPDSSQGSQPKPKKFNLSDLLPAKAPVETSLGTLYVRHAYTSDWKHFEIDGDQKLGKAAVRQLCSRVEDKNDSGPLAVQDLEALNDADFLEIVPVIAKRSGWGEMPAGAGLSELGIAVKAAKEQIIKDNEKMLTDMRKSIGSSYAFLGKDVLERLQGEMAGLATIRSAMAGTGALQEAMRAASTTAAYEEAMRAANFHDTAGRITGAPRAMEILPLPMPPRPENTPLGRATLESAENSREVAQKMDALVDIIAGLNQTMVKDLLPAWVKKVEEDQKRTKDSFDQAAKGLWWTKWAVIVSVVVTMLTTWWQVWVARAIDQNNSEQQKGTDKVLREQLAAQQKLIGQQGLDAAAMREALAALKPTAQVVVPKKLYHGRPTRHPQ
jgi:hypothetical protein